MDWDFQRGAALVYPHVNPLHIDASRRPSSHSFPRKTGLLGRVVQPYECTSSVGNPLKGGLGSQELPSRVLFCHEEEPPLSKYAYQ